MLLLLQNKAVKVHYSSEGFSKSHKHDIFLKKMKNEEICPMNTEVPVNLEVISKIISY